MRVTKSQWEVFLNALAIVIFTLTVMWGWVLLRLNLNSYGYVFAYALWFAGLALTMRLQRLIPEIHKESSYSLLISLIVCLLAFNIGALFG